MPRQQRKHRTRRKRQEEIRREYYEEQRHLSGRRVPGIERPRFNGKTSFSSGHRCRSPRMEPSRQEQEFQAYKNRYLEDNSIRGEKVAEEVLAARL